MRFLINYLRSCFCNHEFEYLDGVSIREYGHTNPYEIHELRDDAPSFEELENMNLDPQSYIEEFCITQ